jgi:hypothetical protein
MSPIRASWILAQLGYILVKEHPNGFKEFKLGGRGFGVPATSEFPDSYIEGARAHAFKLSLEGLPVLDHEPGEARP